MKLPRKLRQSPTVLSATCQQQYDCNCMREVCIGNLFRKQLFIIKPRRICS
jgi:hypothetical protein